MDDFYKKAGGSTILVIKHNGTTHSMANGKGRHNTDREYFPKWHHLLPYMKVGKYYAVLCTISEPRAGKTVSLKPVGIFLEIDDAEDAKALSFEHVKQVESGEWNGYEMYLELFKECSQFKVNFLKALEKQIKEN